MKILALEKETPGVTGEMFKAHLVAETRRVWELYTADVLREIYFRQDRPEAVLVLECESVDAAGEVVATLPLVQAGLISFELIPLGPYPGYGRLFRD